MQTKDTNILVRVSSKLKKRIMEIIGEEQVSLSALINAYLTDTAYRGRIPMYIKPRIRYFESKKKKCELDIPKIKRMLEETIEEMNLKEKIEKAYLFGSFARGEQKETSDVDVRLVVERGFTYSDLGILEESLSDKVKRKIDLSIPSTSDPSNELFLNSIRKDEICIYER